MPQPDLLPEIAKLKRRLYELEKQLSARFHDEALPDGDLMVLTARVGPHPVAFLLDSLHEVVPMAALTPMPESPPWIAGLLNLRGSDVPVIDVLARIQRSPRLCRASEFMVIASAEQRRVGLVVQAIEQVRSVARDRLAPTPTDMPLAPYVLGVLHHDQGSSLLMSIHRLVATSDVGESEP